LRDRTGIGLAPAVLLRIFGQLTQRLIQTFRVGLAPGPLSFLGPYCPTPAAHGHTSTPPAPQSHPRPRKTPRSTDLGVKSTPSGGASGIQDGEGTTDTCGSAEVKVRGGVTPSRHPSAVKTYPTRRRETHASGLREPAASARPSPHPGLPAPSRAQASLRSVSPTTARDRPTGADG